MLRILKRDDGLCQLRYEGTCLGQASDVDHINPGDDHSDTNLHAVCVPCHKVKTHLESLAGRHSQARPAERHPGIRDR